MNSQNRITRHHWLAPSMGLLLAVAVLAGCKGIPTQGERSARKDARAVAQIFRPDGQRPALPELSTNSALGDFLRYAMLNQPQVEAAYFDWRATVERITVERSLPDPRLRFQTDIADIVMSLMPGLMVDIPGPGKLKWAANVAAAESQGRYFQFESSVLQTEERAAAVRHALAELPEEFRVPLILAEYEERSQTEIASILNCSAKAVEMRIYRARQQLREKLGKSLKYFE